MVLEVLPELLEGGLLATEVAGAGTGKLMLPVAAIAGGVAGITASDMKHAAIYSALAGGAINLFHSGQTTPSKLALSMLTSTAVGVIAYHFKEGYVERSQRQHQVKELLGNTRG